MHRVFVLSPILAKKKHHKLKFSKLLSSPVLSDVSVQTDRFLALSVAVLTRVLNPLHLLNETGDIFFDSGKNLYNNMGL